MIAINSLILVLIFILLMFVLFLSDMRIGIAMSLVGLLGIICLRVANGIPLTFAFRMALGSFVNGPFASTCKETLAVIPMFTLMGVLCAHAGISRELYNACYKWLSRVRGGLAIATVISCALFGAVCGSATATTASMGKICLPEMDQYQYNRRLSCGAIASGGTLGILIPPSTGFMLYGICAGVGVGKMFIAGILPGIVLALCFSVTILFLCLKDPLAGPVGDRFPLLDRLRSLRGLIPVLALFVLVLGGILTGWCSATEGGAIGAAGALLFLLIRKKLTFKTLYSALKETVETTAMIFFIMIGSDILSQFLALAHINQFLSALVTDAALNRWVVLALCLGVFALFGCFVDTLPLICMLTPIFLPVIRQLGFDTVWFGVLMVMLMQFGLITPPVGMSCYVMNGITKASTPLSEIFKGTAPFLIAISVAIIIVIVCPWLALWLPGVMSA